MVVWPSPANVRRVAERFLHKPQRAADENMMPTMNGGEIGIGSNDVVVIDEEMTCRIWGTTVNG
ncbi:MAG: hypothetical protein ACLSHC_15550 [Bilophila wadsworthia]